MFYYYAVLGFVGQYSKAGDKGMAVSTVLLGLQYRGGFVYSCSGFDNGQLRCRRAGILGGHWSGGQSIFRLGGVIFNIANILLVAAIDIAGLAVAFPIGIGLALVIGVISTYFVDPSGKAAILFAGVGAVAVAIILDSIAYKKLPSDGQKTTVKGIVLSVLCGILMGFFYRFVAASMPSDLANLGLESEAGKLTPYTALVVFAIGLFVSNFVFNTIVMAKPFVGEPVSYADYFKKGNTKLHLVGILGGAIWGVGMSFSILAGDSAGYAVSYGLGQGATMIAALWGVFIWKEFKAAPAGTNKLLGVMFVFYIIGLVLILLANT